MRAPGSGRGKDPAGRLGRKGAGDETIAVHGRCWLRTATCSRDLTFSWGRPCADSRPDAAPCGPHRWTGAGPPAVPVLAAWDREGAGGSGGNFLWTRTSTLQPNTDPGLHQILISAGGSSPAVSVQTCHCHALFLLRDGWPKDDERLIPGKQVGGPGTREASAHPSTSSLSAAALTKHVPFPSTA